MPPTPILLVQPFGHQRRAGRHSGFDLGCLRLISRPRHHALLLARLAQANAAPDALTTARDPLLFGRLQGLMLVSVSVLAGIMDLCTPERAIVSAMLGQPPQMYCLEAIDSVGLASESEPHPMVYPLGNPHIRDGFLCSTYRAAYEVSSAFTDTVAPLCVTRAVGGVAVPQAETVAEVLRAWHRAYGSSEIVVVAVQAIDVLCLLITRGQWKTIGLLPYNGQFLLKHGMSAQMLDGERPPRACEEDPMIDFANPSGYSEIADLLYRFASRVLLTSIDEEEDRTLLETAISFLNAAADHQTPLGNTTLPWGGVGYKYKAVTMITCFSLSSLLKDDSKLKEGLELALRMAYPAAVAQSLTQMLSTQEVHVPGVSTISRFRLIIDTGFMAWIRQHGMQWIKEVPATAAALVLHAVNNK